MRLDVKCFVFEIEFSGIRHFIIWWSMRGSAHGPHETVVSDISGEVIGLFDIW